MVAKAIIELQTISGLKIFSSRNGPQCYIELDHCGPSRRWFYFWLP